MIICRSLIKTGFSTLSVIKSKMTKQPRTYQGAIEALNTLQTNSQYLKNAVANPKPEETTGEMIKYLNRTGVTLDDLDKLSVIHITGTKGKGTTCAYCENILRNHAFKTGFYSSPHLLDVRERIRINGKPISKDEFASQFWRIFEILEEQQAHPGDMPMYFRILTILAFHIFLKNNVDVAILEVGIGGEFDCTNVIRKTVVAGITPLDLDHTALLGHSIESIAWNKSGVMKENSLAFTTEQPEDAMKILLERSLEKKCHLQVVENVYNFDSNKNIPIFVQKTNANLALAITEAYISRVSQNNQNSKTFSMEIARKSIEETYWPGRYEIKQLNKLRFFLDGAHTINSIAVCSNWFRKMSSPTSKKALIFNLTGNRETSKFFHELHKISFDTVIFIPNIGSDKNIAANKDVNATAEQQIEKCKRYKEDWLKMKGALEYKDDVQVFSSFSNAVEYLEKEEFDVLVTGSIHLVGAAFSVLDPTLNGLLDA